MPLRPLLAALALRSFLRPCPAGLPRVGRPAPRSRKSRRQIRCGWPATARAIIPSTGLLNDLWAKALVLEDAHGTRVAIVTLDLVGIGRDLADPISAELAEQVSSSRRPTWRSAARTRTADRWSATTCGRCTTTWSTIVNSELIDAYAEDLQQKIVEVVGQAVAALAPSEISWGQRQGHVCRQSPQQQRARRAAVARRGQAGRTVRSRRAGAQSHRRRPAS